MSIKLTVWNEFRHEKNEETIKNVYPDGIHNAIAKSFEGVEDIQVRTATLDEPECGLSDETLNDTDVLIWWGHAAHEEVPDALVAKIQQAVLKGMGLIVLHSGHCSKPFRSLMGTSCRLNWRDNDRERIWVTAPNHPIAKGLPEHFELPHEEMYGEFFDIPKPDDVVFTGWFAGGEVFRSGCTFTRGHGRIFYFQPGHESFPIYYDENIKKVLNNAVRWVAPVKRIGDLFCNNSASLEEVK